MVNGCLRDFDASQGFLQRGVVVVVHLGQGRSAVLELLKLGLQVYRSKSRNNRADELVTQPVSMKTWLPNTAHLGVITGQDRHGGVVPEQSIYHARPDASGADDSEFGERGHTCPKRAGRLVVLELLRGN